MLIQRVLIHISRTEQRVIDPADIYFLESSGRHTLVRSRSRSPLVDLREIGEVAPLLEPHGILRIHRHYAVNLNHVRTLRLQADGRDWELKLKPPVNKVLAVARDRLQAVRQALGTTGPA